MSIADIRKSARRSLHDFMGRPAAYFADPHTAAPEAVAITARPHSKTAKAGDLAGTNLSYAETHDRKETIVLWREQISEPARNAAIVFSADEGYFVDNVLPPDGQTVTVEVIRCVGSDLDGLSDPDGNLISSGA